MIEPAPDLALFALPGIPLVRSGDDLAGLVAAAMARAGLEARHGDVIVLAQKVVSKAEGRLVDLAMITPSPRALALAAEVGKDPRFVEVVLSESRAIVRHRPNLLIVEHRQGWVMANAGVDQSNVANDGGEWVLLLPEDSDASAERLRTQLQNRLHCQLGVIINDSFGRPWRRGTVGVALGAAGLPALSDMRGWPDLFGRELKITETGLADEVAAAASVLMGQAAEGRPAVLVRGLSPNGPASPAITLVRPSEQDLFR